MHRMIVNSSNQQSPDSPLPTVATPTTTSTFPQPSTTTKTWPPPPPPPPPSATTKPPSHHPTTFPPEHHSAMLGLRNILLIAPSSSSCHHHHHHHHPSLHEPYNNNNSNLNETGFWSLKRRQESSSKDHVDDNDDEDDHQSFMKVCRDCGNRAKKECSFSRCRTCCKSRGYDCATHIRSTWVPTSKRREKKLTAEGSGGGGGGGSSGSSSCAVKRPKVALSSENVTATTTSGSFHAPPTLCFTGSVPQDASFKKALPGQVKAPAVFRCISVTAINDGDAEVAYVATVNISGHIFKGFLYDQGIDEKNLFPCISKLHMEASTSGKNRDSSSPIVDPSNTCAASAT